MRVLHVGWGYSPWWSGGGLILYTEALLRAQAERGHEVSYLFGGRDLPFLRRPRLYRWRRDGVRMLEILSGRTPAGGDRGVRQPALELDEPATEPLIHEALERTRPDVVHLQTFEGMPSSIIDVLSAAGVPSLMTLEDYHALCPTLKLWDHAGRVCRRMRPGATCVTCCSEGAHGTELQRYMTRDMVVRETRARFPHPIAGRIADGVWRRLPAPPITDVDVAPPAEFDRRRVVNVRRLSQLDALVAMSPGVAEMCSTLGVSRERLRVMRLTMPHIERMTPRRRDARGGPVHFATLNGASSTAKGADMLLDAVTRLTSAGLEERFRLRVHGKVVAHVRDGLAQSPSVELVGPYRPEDLESVLAEADVGIVPSVWEEAYGYVGAEMVAAGLPVISNRRGGLPFHTIPGRTGWLNDTADGAGLAALMARLARDPAEVGRMSERAIAHRAEVITPYAEHLDALDALYDELIAARGGRLAWRG